MPTRISATAQATALLRRLGEQHGSLLIHQSGGCCDGSGPLCLKQTEFRVSSRDVLLGAIEETPFYIGLAQNEYLEKTDFLLEVVPGENDTFSLEASEGVRFLLRSIERPE
jgi:uncharacterized protein